jgi:hypothetical protein
MLLSTSTTAFLGIFLFFCLALFDVVSGRTRLVPPKGQLTSGYIMAVAAIIVAAFGCLVVVAMNWAAINIILHMTLFNKSGSTSFKERSYADYLALVIFAKTHGIGVGLGSHKANSLLLTLLSNTGIIGVTLFGSSIWALLRWRLPKATQTPGGPGAFFARPFQLGLIGLLLSHLFSNPNLSTMTLWLSMGGLLALQAWERQRHLSAGLTTTSGRRDGPAAARDTPGSPVHALV